VVAGGARRLIYGRLLWWPLGVCAGGRAFDGRAAGVRCRSGGVGPQREGGGMAHGTVRGRNKQASSVLRPCSFPLQAERVIEQHRQGGICEMRNDCCAYEHPSDHWMNAECRRLDEMLN